MPSTNKTDNLNLNLFIGSDKPKRSDFNADNQAIEDYCTAHSNNSILHLSSLERTSLSSSIITGTYTGDGNPTKTISLSDTDVKLFFVFKADSPLTQLDSINNSTIINSASSVLSNNTLGISSSGSEFTLSQSDPEENPSIFINLNKLDNTYFYIAFKNPLPLA